MSIIILKHFFHSSLTRSIFVCLYYFTERARSSQSEVIPLFDVRQTSGILVSILRCFSNGSNFCTYIHNNIHYTCYQIIRYYCHRFSSNAHIIQRSSVIPNPLHRAFNITIKPYTWIVLFQHLNTWYSSTFSFSYHIYSFLTNACALNIIILCSYYQRHIFYNNICIINLDNPIDNSVVYTFECNNIMTPSAVKHNLSP